MKQGANKVFMFLDALPQKQGSGANLRIYSNVRAYLDLGFAVELILITKDSVEGHASGDLKNLVLTRVVGAGPQSSSMMGRLMFRAGWPQKTAIEYYVQQHPIIMREIGSRFQQAPEAIFHLEGEAMASALPWLSKGMKSLWSLHDLPSTVSEATTRIACDAEARKPTLAEIREARFTRNAERLFARHAPLVLCIADYDETRLRKWGCRAVDYLPLSIPDEDRVLTTKRWLPGGKLRLLHLGSVGHLPSYRSLEFILDHVWPRLSAEAHQQVVLNVVGTADPENQRTKRILSKAAPYANVIFHGFVPDVRPYYDESDLQVVASTDASGLRTRTIESFAYGLPVLSSSVGARGIGRVVADRDFIVADDPAEWLSVFTRILNGVEDLPGLALRARKFYDENNSRQAVAESLANSLKRHLDVRLDRFEVNSEAADLNQPTSRTSS